VVAGSVRSVSYPVTYTRKIRYSDTDAQGIVFNANYLRYVDDAIVDYFDALTVNWSQMNERGYDLVLGRAEIDFRSPGRLGDVLSTGVRVESVGTSSIVFDISIVDATDRLVVAGKEIQVMVDHQTYEKSAVPPWFVEAVEELQGPVEWKGRS